MKNKATPFGMLSLVLLALPVAKAAVIQTDFGTGDGTTPGGAFVSAGNLLATNFSSATSSGTFYQGVSPDISTVYDGLLIVTNNDDPMMPNVATHNTKMMPNVATVQFNLNGAFNLTTIRTYASWQDDGRSGQRYVVNYATAAAPTSFSLLHSIAEYNFPNSTNFPSTMVRLTSSNGFLAENVVSLQFVFNGYQNEGTGFGEFQVLGSQVSSVPEPGTLLPAAALVAGALLRRRRGRASRSGSAAA
jgi:MYXO-CTERM domain-containing protein